MSDCGLFAGLHLRRRFILLFISGTVILKHVFIVGFSLFRYFCMLWNLLSFVHLHMYFVVLSLSLDLLTATTQFHAEFASSEPDSTPNTPAEGCVESSSLSSLSAQENETICAPKKRKKIKRCLSLADSDDSDDETIYTHKKPKKNQKTPKSGRQR